VPNIRIIKESGENGEMRIGKGNVCVRRKFVAVPPCPTSIPCGLNWDRTQICAMGSRLLTEIWHIDTEVYIIL
jgi:hypothetical protein